MPLSAEQMISPWYPVDPARVRSLFAIPSRISASAFLRREIADRMHERLAMIRIAPTKILDAGCGEGADLPLLRKRFPDADIILLDASHAMLLEVGTPERMAGAVCADFAELPFAHASLGMLWANLSLHWHPDLLSVFSAWKQVLKKEGMLLFSCFGPQTLSPLRAAFQQVDGYEHVLPFMEMHDLGDTMVKAGFTSPVLDREVVNVTYESVTKLLSDVRSLGGNALHARRRGLMGKSAWVNLLDYLETMREPDGRISLPFEIIYGHAFCSFSGQERRDEVPLHFFSHCR